MHQTGHHHQPLPPPSAEATDGYLASVVEALGDTPETVIALQFLREGTCEVLCVGDPADFEGIIIQSLDMPTEPMAFGNSAEAIGGLVPHLTGWSCLNVPAHLADALIEPVASAAGTSDMRMMDDVYHLLTRRVPPMSTPSVRILTPADRDLVAAASPALIGNGVDRLLMTLEHGHVAGAVREGELVALAYTFATSERHADIGVVTYPQWRGQGLATAVTSLVAQAIQADERIPVWSCGGTNLASLRTAARVGFEEVSRRVYLIPDLGEDAGSTA
ncbi:MAG: GNAT family N-acetyltransferase [Thermomicrobiales bacterium]